MRYPIAATPGDTAPEPKGPWVVPGTYTVKLTANGKTYTQPLIVKMDPRVKSGTLALNQQFALSKRIVDALAAIQELLPPIDAARARAQAAGNAELAQKLQTLGGAAPGGRGRGAGGGGGRGRGGAGGPPSLSSVSGQLLGIYDATQDGSALPPAQTVAAVHAILAQFETLRAQAAALLK